MIIGPTDSGCIDDNVRPIDAGPPVGATAKEVAKRTDAKAHVLPLDGLRGFAVLAVMGFHFWQFAGGLGDTRLFSIISIGQKGVDLFFVLSGFLITGILLETKGGKSYFRTFYARRALRILPLYYLVVTGYTVVALMSGNLGSAQRTWWYYVYLQNVADTFWSQAVSGPGHFWSLAVEEHFYLLWPVLVILLSRRHLLIATISIILGAMCFRVWFITHSLNVFTFTLCRMDSLAVGALVAILSIGPRWGSIQAFARNAIVPIGIVSFASFFVLPGLHQSWLQTCKYTLFAVLCAMLLVLAISPGRYNFVPSTFSQGWLRITGRISYGMYAFHPFVFAYVLSHFNVRNGFRELTAAFIASIAGTYLAATISWFGFERPILTFKRRFQYITTRA